LKILLFRIKKCQQLGIRDKDIDVMTLTMVNLQHQGCAPAKRPVFDKLLSRINLTDVPARYSK